MLYEELSVTFGRSLLCLVSVIVLLCSLFSEHCRGGVGYKEGSAGLGVWFWKENAQRGVGVGDEVD